MPKLYLKRLNFIVIKPTENSYLQINDSGQNGRHFVFMQICIQTQTKLSRNDIYLFTLPKYDLKANL